MNLTGKVSLITGGAQGFGRLFSENLLKKGAKVCIADVNQSKGEATTRDLGRRFGDGRVMFVKCDVTSESEFTNAFKKAKERFGGIDIVCNNAGIADESRWRLTVEIDLTSVIQGTLLGIDYMRPDKGGRGGVIINVASTAGLVPVDFTPAYAASKTGVVAYTRSWAENPLSKKMGIRFCALCPSFADTDIIRGDYTQVLDVKRFEKAMEYVGIMEPETVAEAFMELVETENNNGAVLAVTKHHGKKYVPPPPRL